MLSPGHNAAVNEWIQANEMLLFCLGGASMLLFVATLFGVPWLFTRIPHDYFAHHRRLRAPWAKHHPALRGVLLVAKNLLGALFVVMGVAMLVLPGQGVATILAGIVLLDFPGKYRLERWVVGRRSVLRSINWLRRWAGRPPLVLDAPGNREDDPSSDDS